MARGSAKSRIKPKRSAASRTARAQSSARRSKAQKRPAKRVRVVAARPTRARRPARPLPLPDPLSERAFTTSLERSLRDYRPLWEALAKR